MRIETKDFAHAIFTRALWPADTAFPLHRVTYAAVARANAPKVLQKLFPEESCWPDSEPGAGNRGLSILLGNTFVEMVVIGGMWKEVCRPFEYYVTDEILRLTALHVREAQRKRQYDELRLAGGRA
jgi:hypothetical protein